MMYRRPDLFNAILEKNTDAVIAYLNAQIDSGVDAVMVFDTWAVHCLMKLICSSLCRA